MSSICGRSILLSVTPGSLALYLRLERLMELVERGLAQVDELGQGQVVELFEVMTQRGVYLGFAGRRVEDVVIPDAFLLRQLDGQQQERRVDAFVRRVLEIVPAQETEHEPKLGKAELGPVAPRFADDLVEHAGNVRCVLESQVFAQRDRACLR